MVRMNNNNPNLNHSQASSKSRYQWMVHYLKGGELPGYAKPTSDYRGIIGKAPHVKRRKI